MGTGGMFGGTTKRTRNKDGRKNSAKENSKLQKLIVDVTDEQKKKLDCQLFTEQGWTYCQFKSNCETLKDLKCMKFGEPKTGAQSFVHDKGFRRCSDIKFNDDLSYTFILPK